MNDTCDECGGEMIYGCGRRIHAENVGPLFADPNFEDTCPDA